MYIPKPFAITDQSEILNFIEANAFAQLISTSAGRLCCTHLPVLVSEDGSKLIGHIARQNPQAQDIEGQEVLVTFQGAHGYISPSWYSQPGVPTWNYQAVHVYGRCRVVNEPEKLKEWVDALTRKYESALPQPWQPQYNPAMLNAIVGLEVLISEVQGKFKLSQNRSGEDQQQVVEALQAHGSVELALAMIRSRDLRQF